MEEEKNILKWLNGDMSDRELAAFKQTSAYKKYAQIAQYASDLKPNQLNTTQAYAAFKNKAEAKNTTPKVIKPNFNWISAAAAAVVAVLITTYFIFSNPATTTEAKLAQLTQTQLPDQSEVLLNSGSLLTYVKNDWDKNKREVKLKGEAYFKVTKGSNFIVETSAGKVQVLGTQFNVKERKDYFEVHCYEGRVRVDHGGKKLVLTPGERYRFINGTGKKMTGLPATQPSWTLDESSFDAIPLKYVLNELERKFDITITTQSIDLDQLFAGSFGNKNLDKALRAVTVPLGIEYDDTNPKNIRLYANNQ